MNVLTVVIRNVFAIFSLYEKILSLLYDVIIKATNGEGGEGRVLYSCYFGRKCHYYLCLNIFFQIYGFDIGLSDYKNANFICVRILYFSFIILIRTC